MEAVSTSPIEALIEEIAANGKSARPAIAGCRARLAESAPFFRAVLERAIAGDCDGEAESNLLFTGLHILGEGRDAATFPMLLRLVRVPEDELEWLLGDASTESLPRIMAGVFDGDADALFEACADPQIYDIIRWGLIATAAFLTWEGRIDLEKMVHFLERFDDERLGGHAEGAWIGWCDATALLGLKQFRPRVERALRDGRVDSSFMTPEDWKEMLARSEAAPGDGDRFRQERLGYIEDVITELDRWEYVDSPQPHFRHAFDNKTPPASEDFGREAGSFPAVNEWRNVGRNDPCPCGSGKKFKRCCLGTL
jgi:hypothetical protein